MSVEFDVRAPIKFSKALERAAAKGLTGGGLGVAQMKSVWRQSSKEIIRAAAPAAPVSGRSGPVTWRSRGYSYTGKHGDIGRQIGYGGKPFRSGLGVRVAIGGIRSARQSERKKLAGLVGNFATHNVRRRAGGRARVGPRRDWLGEANIRTAGRQARVLVETYDKAVKVSHPDLARRL